MKTVGPIYTFIVLVIIGASCMLAAYFWPRENIETPFGEVKFASIDIFNPFLKKEKSLDVDALLNSYVVEPIDSTAIEKAKTDKQTADSLAQLEAENAAKLAAFERLQIRFDSSDTKRLDAFFEALKNSKNKVIDILHYGDSQIEGDRITGFLRNEWQERWGGFGPGMVPIVEAVPSSAVKQTSSSNLARYALFANAAKPEHDRFGMMAAFSQMPRNEETIQQTGWVSYKPSRLSHWRAKKYKKGKLFFGNSPDSAVMRFFLNDSLVATDSLPPFSEFRTKKFNWGSTPNEFKIEFEGNSSPELYGMNLHSGNGIQLHNLAMRGSSGTIFKKINQEQLKSQYGHFNAKLVLLQYGGNSVPYVKTKEQADRYGSWFGSQIKRLKKLMPNACFIVIGPSDMAIKNGEEFETYPYLEEVRDALRQAAFDNRCGFWDIYNVMGGKNSMKSWVSAEPPLAGSDYVHFTPSGAKEIGKLFDQALMEQFKIWSNEP